MMKTVLTFLSLFAAAGLAEAAAPRSEHLDLKGDRIENRLDIKGDRINDRLDRRASLAETNGHERRAIHLDRKGNIIDYRLDNKGSRINHRLDRRSAQLSRRPRG